ncbi:hypothetical protein BDZ94DRAFT_1177478 [Collybia nuda]|uniref:Uncharacterized protein n=1 Tax=Collybia nuda TaxID=64659 RepID=A0A9P6C8Z6_9AGAR|nr:hypothetical protein BDZ94DRAFT_1177478 [Collybia nuda]
MADLLSDPRFSTCSCRFMDAYYKGLDGKQAVWAAKKFHGHRVVLRFLFSFHYLILSYTI